MTARATCETCRFFVRRLFATGPCLRRAPLLDPSKASLTDCGNTSARWPWVDKRDWCGDYEQGREAVTS